MLTHVSAERNPKYDTDSGNDVCDAIFLLSVEEVRQYFGENDLGELLTTPYACEKNIYTLWGNSFWWLRSPGYRSNNAARINLTGSINYRGCYVDYNRGAVRPALWLNIDN